MAHADTGKFKRTEKAKAISRSKQKVVKDLSERKKRRRTVKAPTVEERLNTPTITSPPTQERSTVAAISPDRLTQEQLNPRDQPKAILDPISPQQISTSPIVRLTAGGLIDADLGLLDKAAPSSGTAGIDFPLVQLTAGNVGFGSDITTQFRNVLVSADTAIKQGVLYDPNLIQEGYVGPGIEGNGAFIVTDLADVALIASANPGADIYYNDPNDVGPPRAVSGTAAFVPALEKFLLTQFGGLDEVIPDSILEVLVRNGLLEEDGGELFPDVPFGFGGGFGGGGFGGGGGGFGGGRGRAPSVGSFRDGLFNWRISA